MKVTWDGQQAKVAARAGAARGVTMAAHRVQAVSVARTPMDVGDLRSSQIVTPADPDPNPTAAVSSDLPYAARQHEGLHFRHKHGQAKFLESALNDSRREVEAIIAEQTRRAFGGP